ncbi:TRAP transporter large permease [Gordonia sp. zg691]|uniref:TRAP transporter large permease n=1 Tax=Gordonia jinghuaiqii TaxID=2758710 RepID=A0A7D7R2Z1_9ACTN|nr:TRAP transporter large permease [Gordonia jinghuaiqii]MBD0863138.1 TRAP transporter large permease [Gordonia jinghuaiqii]MCR5980351.1 TRAP transporter large permease subunit [Gordonia jinghuaiqii]QMT01907.1 TRAP transporter large permease [Gordonia jinghuaiqii]
MIALLLLVILIGLIIIRVPVSFAIMAAGLVGLVVMSGGQLGAVNGIMEVIPVSSVQTLSLSAIPLFILMAHFMLMSGLMDSLFDAGRTFFGRTPGGTGIASTLAGVGFSAVSGSSTAAAATLAKTTSTRMIEEGYRPTTATGIVASVGTLAGMIPPSIILVFYAVTAEANVGDLIIAGIVPGLIIAAALMITMFIPILFDPSSVPAGQPSPVSEKLKKIVPALPIAIIFAVVVGAIYFGLATPTESAAIGCLAAFLLVVARRRGTWQGFVDALIETVKTSAMIFAIVIAAHVFGHAFTETKVAERLLEWVGELGVPSLVIMGMLLLMYLVLGFFMDQVAIIALTVPIVLPLVESLGYDAVWFGIFVVLMGEIGLITPPLGLNVFVVARAAGRDTVEVFRGSAPYAGAMVVVAIVFVLWPELVLWLPNLM